MKKALKITGKILLGILITLTVAIIILLVVRLIGRSANSKTPDGGINESMLVDINGTQQWINIYGQDKDNPVLLYLHGGPGSATSHLDYAFTRKWSDVYTVVTWDQRGCGKSYGTSKTETITASLMMQDGHTRKSPCCRDGNRGSVPQDSYIIPLSLYSQLFLVSL